MGKRFTITTFRDCDVKGVGNPLQCERYSTACGKNYLRVTTTGTQFYECYTGGVANYRHLEKFPVGKRKRVKCSPALSDSKVSDDDHSPIKQMKKEIPP